jgi:hypothetical protein
MVGGLRSSNEKCSHTDATQTIKHLPPLNVDLEKLEHASLSLSNWEARDPSSHLTLRMKGI